MGMKEIDKNFVVEKINLIVRDLKHLETFGSQTIDEIAKDFLKYSALKNILMEIIGRAIDINQHLISSLTPPSLDPPKTYRDTFFRLGEMNILPRDFSEELAKSASLRNIIVHEYDTLHQSSIFQSVAQVVVQYRDYCQHILNYLNNQGGENGGKKIETK
jgi:uncharacterized protein YutE (UPF0331/DUF86 family)